jgi:hypothetical protein
MRERPFIIGGLGFIAGYTFAALAGTERAVSHDLIRFHRAEQIARLRRVVTSVVSRNFKGLALQPASTNDQRSNSRGSTLAPCLVTSRHGLVRLAAIHDEEWIEGEPIPDPEAFIRCLRKTPPADIFSFARPLPAREPRYPFHFDWDNAAAVRTAEFGDWWDSLPQETRKNVRRSQRRGVAVRSVAFSDELVHGILNIYNETPIRQGRKFWHYGKSFEEVKAANATYLDRSEFIGAFVGGELIGFIKLVISNNVARVMQILSLDAHADKRPTNSLLAKAVEVCCKRKISYLVYGKYVYGKKENSSVTEFKRRNGFERLDFPRYYVPLTRRGSFAIRYGLYRELTQVVPEAMVNLFLTTRAAIYRHRFNCSRRFSSKTTLQRSSNQI